jgi:phospholipid-binding lipoprotein MlaA
VYRDYTPKIVQTGVGNFFDNLGNPTTIINQFLQGKFKEGAQDTGRFLLNTTLGWGGLIDVASGGTNLPKHNEDSGQTLGWWGVPPGPYLVLPFLGPATVRDAPARVADDFSQPFRWYNAGSERWISLGLSFLDRRAQYLSLDKTLAQMYDPYVFVRDAYLQRRLYLVFDGNPPQSKLPEEDADWAEEALRESEEPATDESPPAEVSPPDKK